MNGSELLARSLGEAGVRRVFGRPLGDLACVPVNDASVAALVADADGRSNLRPGASFDGRTLRISSRPGGEATPVSLAASTDVAGAVQRAAHATISGAATAEFTIEFDLDAPISGMHRRVVANRHVPASSQTLPTSGRVAMLVGPGVVRTGSVGGLRAFAAAANLGVANTWGAKGVFAWDSPHHLGTCGLQAHDFTLLGFDTADVIIASGLDPDESSLSRLGRAPVITIAPEHLAWYADDVSAATFSPLDSRFYETLGAIAQPGYVDDRFALHPARVVRDTRDALPDNGVVAADPGVVGLWVARTFPTNTLGSVIVPATRAPGIGAALATIAALDDRPAIAMTAGPIDDATAAVLEFARTNDLSLTVVAWGGDDVRSVADYAEQLERAASAPGVSIVGVPVDWSCTGDLEAAAGELLAWSG